MTAFRTSSSYCSSLECEIALIIIISITCHLSHTKTVLIYWASERMGIGC